MGTTFTRPLQGSHIGLLWPVNNDLSSGDERGMPWNRKGEVLASLASAASRERTGSTLSAIRGATNTLELCTDGLWLISPISLDDDTTSTTSTTSTTNTTSTVSFPLYFVSHHTAEEGSGIYATNLTPIPVVQP